MSLYYLHNLYTCRFSRVSAAFLPCSLHWCHNRYEKYNEVFLVANYSGCKRWNIFTCICCIIFENKTSKEWIFICVHEVTLCRAPRKLTFILNWIKRHWEWTEKKKVRKFNIIIISTAKDISKLTNFKREFRSATSKYYFCQANFAQIKLNLYMECISMICQPSNDYINGCLGSCLNRFACAKIGQKVLYLGN